MGNGRRFSANFGSFNSSTWGDTQEMSPRSSGSSFKEQRKQRLEKLSQPSEEHLLAMRALAFFLQQNPTIAKLMGRCIFLRADYLPELFAEEFDDPQGRCCPELPNLFAEQTSRQAFTRLVNGTGSELASDHSSPWPELDGNCLLNLSQERDQEPAPGGLFDSCIYLASAQRQENMQNLAKALGLVRPGGLLVTAAANDFGAQSLEKRFESLFPLEYKYSKFHSRIFAALVPDLKQAEPALQTALAEWSAQLTMQKLPGNQYYSVPGIFSWDKVDEGSQFLAECVLEEVKNHPETLAGKGADLGSGYGYLSCRLLSADMAAESLDLFENEMLAVEASVRNMAEAAQTCQATCRYKCHWADVLWETPDKTYDWIIMNPPFHQGKKRCLPLGHEFVRTAYRALKPGGQLWMVVNKTLLYDDILNEVFKRWQKVKDNNGFKVYRAWR